MNFIKHYAPLLVFLAAMLWATDAPFRVHLTKDLSSSFIVLIEHFLNLIFVIPLLIASRGEFALLRRREWLAVLVIGIGGSGFGGNAFSPAFFFPKTSSS